MVLKQEDAYEVESLARTYLQDGQFSEPFNRVEIHNLDKVLTVNLDINGIVPIPPLTVVVFDCATLGANVSNMQINLNGSTSGVVVYWTKYRGFIWNNEA